MLAGILTVALFACYFCQLQGKGKGGSEYAYYGKGKGAYSGYGSVYGGKGKGKGGYGGYGGGGGGGGAPNGPFPSPPPQQQGPQCTQVAFTEEFLFLSADLAIPLETTDPDEIGTTFIYEPSPLFNATEFRDNGQSVELENSQITGVCTRTQEPVDGVGGGGVCQFTIQVDVGSSVTFGGFIEDFVVGSPPPTLVISGGSGENIGITGEVALLPLDGTGAPFTGDIFFDTFGYEASVSGVILVCEVIQGF